MRWKVRNKNLRLYTMTTIMMWGNIPSLTRIIFVVGICFCLLDFFQPFFFFKKKNTLENNRIAFNIINSRLLNTIKIYIGVINNK